MNKINLMQFYKTLLSSSLIFLSNVSIAAPGTLPKTPLFLTNSVEPNIFYTIDDSGSMEWESMTSSGTGGYNTLGGVPLRGAHQIGTYYMFPVAANGQSVNWGASHYPLTALDINDDPQTWVVKNHIGNKLYYNPAITYSPWQGTDSSGVALYSDAVPTAAQIDPNNAALGTFDLTADVTYRSYLDGWIWTTEFPATYYEWVDTDVDGNLESTDSYTEIEIKPANAPFTNGRTYSEEILNFANWFQYYRKRSFVAKSALGVTLNNADSYRMGIDIFNGGHQIDAQTMSNATYKENMFSALYGLGIHCLAGKGSIYPNTCNGTPAKNALSRVGELFKGTTANPTPIHSSANGGECQQNFNMLVTDGFWNDGVDPSGIGNADKDDSGTQMTDSNGIPYDGSSYADDYQVTLADVAMHYYEHDLSALSDEVPTLAGVDEAEHQHLVTYTVGFGIEGGLDSTSDPSLGGANFWPDPTDGANDEVDRVDDLWHAAYNGRGKYLSAQDPVELAKALDEVAQDIADRTATAAAVAVNSTKLTSQSIVYLAQFNSNKWQGSLYAYLIDDLSTGALKATHEWEAAEELNARNLTTNPREMITYDGIGGVPFKWNSSLLNSGTVASLSSSMKADLKTNASGGTDSDAIGQARLEYIRGDQSNEGSGYSFRTRPSLLGDIVNSGPVFVGEPSLNWPDFAPFPSATGSRYSDYKNGSAKTRKKILYVGSNDGMLHAFDDNTGEEVFTYLPLSLASSAISSGYHYLTDPNYIHNWYVDLTPTLSDVNLTTNAGTGWRSILVSGLRGGGRGLFALDVTDPTLFSELNADKIVMWEFTDSDDSDLGYTYSRPVIALANNGRWVAIFGNGYNDQGSGEATLFILDIEKGVDGWIASDYTKISTGVGTSSNTNGLASPALVDLDANGTVDRVYAGDLEGNMWAFDLSNSNSSQWDVAYKSGPTPSPLFTTPSGQPITSKPVLAKHPTIPYSSSPSNDPNLMVFFGTGQYLVDSDKTTTNTQSFYGVWDRGDKELVPSDLIQQTFNGSFTERVLTTNFVDYSTDHGWYFNLPDTGERSVTSSVARTDTVFFNTFVPEDDPCSVGGYGFKFAVDMATGGSPPETVIDINGDGVIDDNDNVGGGSTVVSAVKQDGYLPEPVFIEDLVFTGATGNKVKPQPDIPDGRFSWQELLK